ncbi:MAG: hypothetical protein M3530_06960 [Thermoproteota archaeon]|nr:hypothetical protein [Thermoproteota archaeon]
MLVDKFQQEIGLGIDDGIVIALPHNITFNLKLCTLPSVRKVAINNMVLN